MLSPSSPPRQLCLAVLWGPSDQDFEITWKLKLEVKSAEVLQDCGIMELVDWRLFGRVRARARLKSAPWGFVGFLFYFSRWICLPWAKRALVMCRSRPGGSPACLLSLLMLAWSAWCGRVFWHCSCCPPTPAQVGLVLWVKVCPDVCKGLYFSCLRLRLIL